MAADRAVADADQEARSIAVLVSSLHDSPSLVDAVESANDHSLAVSTLVLADGRRIGPTDGAGAPTASVLERAGSGAAFTLRGDDGTRIVVPVVTANGTDIVHTWLPAEEMRRGVAKAWLLIALLGVLLTGLALAVADQLGRRASTPVIRVAQIADRLRDGDLEARAVPEGPLETRALARALNRLAERIKELLLAERTAVGDLSHRLRTPVTALRIDVDSVGDPELAERLRRHVGSLQRTVDAIVKDARRPVRHDMDVACDAVAVVRNGVDFWSPLAQDEGRQLEVRLGAGPQLVDMDDVDLRDVLDILIDNVFAHTPEGTAFSVALHSTGPFTPGTQGVVLEVDDRPRDEPAEPVVAARGVRSDGQPGTTRGSGLGLTIARRAVSSAGGELHLDSTPAGTRVTVWLPTASRT
ncbi:MAG: HAMP domain-containing sensor histidine kinase [Nocardioidaceae bacterium]